MNVVKIYSIIIAVALGITGATIFSDLLRVPAFGASPSFLIPILASENVENVGLELIDLSDTAITQDSLRILTESEKGNFWAATDEAGNVCIIAELVSVNSLTYDLGGIACRSLEHFYNGGVSLRLESDFNDGVVAHLLPSDVGIENVHVALSLTEGYVDSKGGVAVHETAGTVIVIVPGEHLENIGDLVLNRNSGGELILPTFSR